MIRKIHKEFGRPRFSVICGASVFVRASLIISLGFVRDLFRFVENENSALDLINQNLHGIEPPVVGANKDVKHQQMEPDLQELMDDIGKLGWVGLTQNFDHIAPSHRLKPVYDALSLVQLDIKHLLEAREQDAESLAHAHVAMESAKRARSELLGIAHHEIRTPLNGLLGMLELLKMTPLSEDGLDYMETAKRCGEDLMSLLTNLLDLSSVETGRLQLKPSRFSPSVLVEELTQKFAPIAQEREVKFLVNTSGPLHLFLFADGNRLSQVLGILLQNASKVTGSGSITFSAKAIQEGLGMVLEFSVKDTSLGISAQDLPRVFAPFQDTDLSFARRFGGIGLGLSVVDQLVRMLGGVVSVESTQGKGSTFSVRLTMPVAV
jgi:signal transduction histidine kinase